MRYVGLRARIARLEARRAARELPKVICAIQGHHGAVVGISGRNGGYVARLSGETVASLHKRAAASLAGVFLRCCYVDTAPMGHSDAASTD